MKDDDTTNVAVVRCDIVAEVCPGIGCFKAFDKRSNEFGEYGPKTRMIGFFTCGGCPGRRVFRLASSLKKHNIDVVHMSSCMLMEKPFTKCPHKAEIKKSITDLGIKVIEGTHSEVGQYASGKRHHD